MMIKEFTISLLFSCFLGGLCAQESTFQYGDKFDFNVKTEIEPMFVLMDDYNSYMLTAVDESGMFNVKKIIMRKFDQSGQLLQVIESNFPEIGPNTIHRYHGSYEVGNEKVVSFSSCHSGKAKIKNVYAHIFDKAKDTFTIQLITSYPIISAMKSGNVYVAISGNGQYFGIQCNKKGEKKEPDTNEIIILEAATLNKVWEREFPEKDKYYDKSFCVTNAGKALFLKSAGGFNTTDYYFDLISANDREEKQIDEKMVIHNGSLIQIGNKEYFIAFDYIPQAVRLGGTNYQNIILYDWEEGEIVNNAKVSVLDKIPSTEVKDLLIRNVYVHRNEIHVFAEALVKAGTKQDPRTSMDKDYYKYGPSYLIILNHAGELISIKNIDISSSSLADLYHSFGALNIKGDYFINSGSSYGIYNLALDGNDEMGTNPLSPVSPEDPFSGTYVTQLYSYLPNSNKFVRARTHGNNKMSLVSVYNLFNL